MKLHAMAPDRRQRPSVRRNGLVQLGQPHFWLLFAILGGMIALFVPILFAHLLAR